MSWPVDPLTRWPFDPDRLGSRLNVTARSNPSAPQRGRKKKKKRNQKLWEKDIRAKIDAPWKSTLFLVLWNSKIFLHSSDSTFVVSRAQGTALSGWICQCPHSVRIPPIRKYGKKGIGIVKLSGSPCWVGCQISSSEQGSIELILQTRWSCKTGWRTGNVFNRSGNGNGNGNIAACWIVWNCNLLRRAYWSQAAQPTMSRHMGQLAVQASRFFYIFHIMSLYSHTDRASWVWKKTPKRVHRHRT